MEKNYLEEIAHRFDLKFYKRTYGFFDKVGLVYPFVNHYSVEGLGNLKGLTEPLIFFPNHESHFDYIFLSYIIFKHLSIVPRIAGGKNLFIGPLDEFLRKCGSFCVDRENNEISYLRQLMNYTKDLLLNNESVLIFIQGGRAGYLRLHKKDVFSEPKLGLLSACIEAQKETNKDIFAVPVKIIWDHAPEENFFYFLDKAKQIENKSISNFFYYGMDITAFLFRFVNPIKGKIRVTFKEQPFSIKDYLEEVKEKSDKEAREGLAGKIIEILKEQI